MNEYRASDDPEQRAAREWLERVLAETGWNPTSLAERAGVAASTINRFLRQDVKHTLSARTLAKISAASGVAIPMNIGHVSESDPETMQQAIAAAREQMRGVETEDIAALEAELVCQFYDVLIEMQRAGVSLEAAVATILAMHRRQRRSPKARK